jgi:hypothetical protein
MAIRPFEQPDFIADHFLPGLYGFASSELHIFPASCLFPRLRVRLPVRILLPAGGYSSGVISIRRGRGA